MEPALKAPSPGMTYGLIAGLAIIIFNLVQYLGGIGWYMNPIGFIIYAILFTVAVLAALKQKKQQGGYLEFGQALKTTFMVCVAALLLQTIFTYILFNFVDVSFKEALSQAAMESTEKFLKKIGAPERQIEEAIDRQMNSDPYSLGNVALGFSMLCVVLFIVCLIISAIIQKKRPPFSDSFNQS